MTEPTRYLTFKLDKFASFLSGPISLVVGELVLEPEGLTFDELVERTGLGPQHLRAVLGDLFKRDYIITIAKLEKKHGVDAQRLRRP